MDLQRLTDWMVFSEPKGLDGVGKDLGGLTDLRGSQACGTRRRMSGAPMAAVVLVEKEPAPVHLHSC